MLWQYGRATALDVAAVEFKSERAHVMDMLR